MVTDRAIEMFVERGYDHVTVADIAEDAQVSQMTFFRNFPYRANVVEAALEDQRSDVFAYIAVAPEGLGPIEMICWSTAMLQKNASPEVLCELARIMKIAAASSTLCLEIFGPQSVNENKHTEALEQRGFARMEARAAAGAYLGAMSGILHELYAIDPSNDFKNFGPILFEALLGEDAAEELAQL